MFTAVAIAALVPLFICALIVAAAWSALGAPAWAERFVGRAPFFGK